MSMRGLARAMVLCGAIWGADTHAGEDEGDETPLMLYAGSSHAAYLRVRRTTDEVDEAIDGRTLRELVARDAPYLVGIEQGTTCDGPATTNELVLRRVVDAHELRVNMNVAGAAEVLTEAARSLECLSQPLESSTGARVHFLLGILRFANGEEDAARAAFELAFVFRPDLTWDDDFAPDARPLFDAVGAAAAEVPKATLRLVAGTADQVRIDGRLPAMRDGVIDVTTGRHIVQVIGASVTTFAVDLPAHTPGWLVIPTAVDDDLLDAVLTADGRSALEGLILGSTVGERTVVWVAHPLETWRFTPGDRTWQQMRVDVARSVRTPLLIGGGATAALGGVLMAVYAYKAHGLASNVQGDQSSAAPMLDTATHGDREAEWRRARTVYWVGTGIGATGVIAATVGGVLFGRPQPNALHLEATALPGGGALQVRIGRRDGARTP